MEVKEEEEEEKEWVGEIWFGVEFEFDFGFDFDFDVDVELELKLEFKLLQLELELEFEFVLVFFLLVSSLIVVRVSFFIFFIFCSILPIFAHVTGADGNETNSGGGMVAFIFTFLPILISIFL